jgi:hypothetical protein
MQNYKVANGAELKHADDSYCYQLTSLVCNQLTALAGGQPLQSGSDITLLSVFGEVVFVINLSYLLSVEVTTVFEMQFQLLFVSQARMTSPFVL